MELPLFPLQSVFFPGETVPLHIFEDRYKQLISDCRAEAMTFGIPVYINDKLEYGVEVQLVEVVTTYDSGEMDVVCVVESNNDAPEELRLKVLSKIEELYDLMAVQLPQIAVDKFNSYAFAHKMGLSFEQEYELLQLTNETVRLNYIKEHLTTTITVLNQINRTKAVIEMNGHFKNFDPLDFEDFKVD